MKLEKVHEYELKMLEYFNRFCEENNLNYTIDAGTLIGAVRGGTFIPWDDDVDVLMKRIQYEKLKSVANKFENDKYKILFINSASDYYYPYIKIIDKRTKLTEANHKKIRELGIFMDVFPADKVPMNRFTRFFYFHKISILRKLNMSSMQLNSYSENKIKRFLFPVVKKLSTRSLAVHLDKCAKKYNHSNSTIYMNAVGNPKKIIFSIELIGKTTQIKFDDLYLPAPYNYDEYLRNYYGDYMKLPPINERINHKLDVIQKC